MNFVLKKRFDDNKGILRSSKLKDRQCNDKIQNKRRKDIELSTLYNSSSIVMTMYRREQTILTI